MKKFLALLLSLVFIVSLAACGGSNLTTEQAELKNQSDHEVSKTIVVTFAPEQPIEKIANFVSTDLKSFQSFIVPKEEYTAADMKIADKNSRVYKESQDDTARPEIKSEIQDFENYVNVFIGYPIWYEKTPKIIFSFLDKYDLKGKNVYLFCTSKTTNITKSKDELTQYLDGKATIVDAKRFSDKATEEEISKWIDSLGIEK